ncbi:P-loop NTPase fold protein, partial [Flavobacterium sp. A45]|uniref:KAP family P-loop NTPase fold protein n=1 Tax=Flavobacterium sp. A45 TaxID=1945862 RepID=UPI000986EAED
MKIKHNEIEIDCSNPFLNCKLGRQKYSTVLTEILDSYPEGFVLAINNKWGTGKTTFIKMWEQDLKNKNYQTVYFNAWENDFENNPLVALMGELKTLTNTKTVPAFNKTLKKASILSKQILPVIAQAVADKYIDTKEIKDLINGVSKGIADVFENDVNEYAKKKKSIIEFRTSLASFIANTNQGKSLVFIIDELDRCRPNYAVSILEQIKHFFTVPNIVFVLSIDKEQLGNAVRGVYGSDRIDADEYLRRFIDIEYSIPKPEKEVYNKYLYDYFRFDDFLEKETRKRHSELNSDKKSFLQISEILFSNSPITLRQQEKIFSHSRLALRAFKDNMYLIPEVFLFLIFIKVTDEEKYNKIKSKQLTITELQEEYYKIVKDKLNNDT